VTKCKAAYEDQQVQSESLASNESHEVDITPMTFIITQTLRVRGLLSSIRFRTSWRYRIFRTENWRLRRIWLQLLPRDTMRGQWWPWTDMRVRACHIENMRVTFKLGVHCLANIFLFEAQHLLYYGLPQVFTVSPGNW